jgi:hypothetical protein
MTSSPVVGGLGGLERPATTGAAGRVDGASMGIGAFVALAVGRAALAALAATRFTALGEVPRSHAPSESDSAVRATQ